MENQHITLNGRAIPLAIRRHKSARRVSIRLTPAGDGVTLTLPARGNLHKAMGFLHQKADWILTHVLQDTKVRLIDGASIQVLGEAYQIQRIEGRGVACLSHGVLQVYGAPEFTARRVKDFLKKHLYAYGVPRVQAMAAALEKTIQSVRIGDTRARWGSCTASGNVTLNWRLIFAPPAILEYVIAHEVAHLGEMNHSPRFWSCVAVLHTDYQNARGWLKREGHTLYRYQ
jgi:predicted metal-dependent hydrolase